MNKIIIYSHAGSSNHGCEALLRTTVELCPYKPHIYSVHGDDYLYGSDKIADYSVVNYFKPKSFVHYVLKFMSLFVKDKSVYVKYWYKGFDRLNRDNDVKVALAIGGDTYCYGNNTMHYSQNVFFNKRGIKTILWGCSIEPNSLKDPELIADLNRYSIIIARESITLNALKSANIRTKILYCPDPAFALPCERIDLDKDYSNAIGINISPMIIKYEKIKGIVIENYSNLINDLIQKGFDIALIPHVVSNEGNDLDVLTLLYERFKDTGKIWLVDERKKYNCMQLKYVISQCKMFVAARTHASIAAYSTFVPTLVVGYSVKAKGIALDLFGDYDDYVISVDELKDSTVLTRKFEYIIKHNNDIHDRLYNKVAEYKESMSKYTNCITELLDD